MVRNRDKPAERDATPPLPKPPTLTLEDLYRTVATFPAHLNEGERAQALCGAVIRHFFGLAWIQKHMLPPSAPASGYLRLFDGPANKENMSRMLRVFDFAEALYNLREIPGLEACLQQLSDGLIESGCAELDFARMLHAHEIPFRFVVPQKLKRGEDYDFTIVYPDGLEVAADAKCKFESTAIDPKSVLNTLHDARDQLPKGEPGILFVKVPPPWIQKVDMANAIVATAAQFFARGTRRVVSVKFYAQPIIYTDEVTAGVHIYSEVSNPNAIIPNRNWDLFKGTRQIHLAPNRAGMPDWWVKFMYFPTGIPRGPQDDAKT